MAQNAFVKAATLDPALTNVRTENGALSYATIGSALLDQFGKAGTARGRDINTVWAEQSKLWADDPRTALRFPFYLRMITRQANVGNGEKTAKVQRGQGAKDESFKRMLWIAKYHPETFYANLWLVPVVGSWKDLWVLMSMDKTLDRKKFFEVMAEGINDPGFVDLVKKYMPRIRSNSKCKTEWAKQSNEDAKSFAKFAGWSFEDYRTFKATGKAHTFQTYMCKGLYSKIDWNTIPGKALLNLVTGKFLDTHNLNDSYIKWLKAQPVAKFNGYAFELGHKLGGGNTWVRSYTQPSLATKITIDKQFRGLIETAKKDDGGIKGNVLCALDTSGSMTAEIQGANGVTSYDVCVSLGIYFSELNEGAFHNVVAMFDDTSELFNLSGEFSDKWSQIRNRRDAMGSTNFQSLIDLIVATRNKHPEIPLSEFPQTLLVVSDMQFNPAGRSSWDMYCGRGWSSEDEQTNYQMAMRKLSQVFPYEFVENFKIIWWYCAGRPTNDYPTNTTNKGTYMISGFDGSVISFVLGGDEKTSVKTQKTMEEVVEEALSQESLEFLKVVD